MTKQPFGELAKYVVSPLFWARSETDIRCIGSLFVIALAGTQALAITARHCIDYVRRESGLDYLRDLAVSPLFRRPQPLSLSKAIGAENFEIPCEGALFTHVKTGNCLAEVTGFDFIPHDALDVALLRLRLPEKARRFEAVFPLQTRGPLVGDKVALFGFANQSELKIVRESPKSARARFSLQDQTRVGEVTDVFGWNEHRLVRSPCFRVNKAVNSGVSGGTALLYNGDIPVVCGMVSASSDQETVCSILYPALALRNPIDASTQFPLGNSRLLDLIRLGAIRDLSAHLHLTFREDDPFGDPADFARWSN